MATPPPIGRKIKRARERLRLKQAQLGDAIGVSQKTIDNWEHDRRYPKSSIGALESVLGISLDGGEPAQVISPALRRQIHEELGPADAARAIAILERTLVRAPGEGPAEGQAQPGR